MFCSHCKRIEFEFTGFRRRICESGHVFCKTCDSGEDNCCICSVKFSNILTIEVTDQVPRLLFSKISEKKCEELESSLEKSDELESSSESKEGQQNTSNESNSFIQMVNDLKQYDAHCAAKNSKPTEHPVIGCYQVKAHMRNDQISYTLSLDDDEERMLMKNFRVEEKSMKCEIKKAQKTRSSDKKSVSIRSKKNSIDGSGDASSLLVHQSTKDAFSRSHTDLSFTTRSECYEDGPISSIDTESLAESAIQIYKNTKVSSDSDMINFTSLSVSRTEISPPKDTSKAKPTNAHRVSFSPVYRCIDKLPPQMEPLAFYEPHDESDEEEKNTENIPRMPVHCPITTCDMATLPSDFCNHVSSHHPYIHIIKLAPYKMINLTIYPAGSANHVACHYLLLLSDKITDIGFGAYENCLPILVLACKFNLRKLLGCPTKKLSQDDMKNSERLCIWLAGVYQFPVNYALNVWTHGRDASEPNYIKSISTSITHLNEQENPLKIATSALSLSPLEIETLTSNGETLCCQIVFS